jgi:hypothetical protein
MRSCPCSWSDYHHTAHQHAAADIVLFCLLDFPSFELADRLERPDLLECVGFSIAPRGE